MSSLGRALLIVLFRLFGALRGLSVVFAKAPLRALQVLAVGAVLDVSASAIPVLLQAVVALNDCLELEALGRVLESDLAKGLDASVQVLTWNRRLDAFDPHEVLFIESTHPFESGLKLFEFVVEFSWGHGRSLEELAEVSLALVLENCATGRNSVSVSLAIVRRGDGLSRGSVAPQDQ